MGLKLNMTLLVVIYYVISVLYSVLFMHNICYLTDRFIFTQTKCRICFKILFNFCDDSNTCIVTTSLLDHFGFTHFCFCKYEIHNPLTPFL